MANSMRGRKSGAAGLMIFSILVASLQSLSASEPLSEKKTPVEILRLKHDQPTAAVEFINQSNMVLTACSDGFLRVWDSKGKIEKSIKTGGKPMYVSVRKESQTVFVSTLDTIESWDIRNEKLLWQIKSEQLGESETIGDIAISPGQKTLAACLAWNDILLLDSECGKITRRLNRRGSTIDWCRFSNDGKKFLAVYGDSRVVVWDTEKWQGTTSIREGIEPVHHAGFSPDGKQIVISGDKMIRLWDPPKGEFSRDFSGHNGEPTALLFADEEHLFSGDTAGFVVRWNVQNGKKVWELRCHQEEITNLAMSDDGKKLAVACVSGEVAVLDLEPR